MAARFVDIRHRLRLRAFAFLVMTSVLMPATLVGAAETPRPFSHPDRIRYDDQCLTIDGKDIVIYSGAFHYFRCPKELWRDRFRRIKEAGFNTVETYIAWNVQERQAPAGLDDYSKANMDDVDDWLTMAEEFGLFVIIRPGPYICAEWERGALPGWLITKRPADRKGVWFRTDDPDFIAWSKHWYHAVCPTIVKHQITRREPGRPGIILFQLENEYDFSRLPAGVMTNYVKALGEAAAAEGIDVPFMTCWTHVVRGSSDPVLRGVFDSCNFYPGWDVNSTLGNVGKLRHEQPDAPLMTTELQGGWFTDAMGDPPIRPNVDHYRDDLVPAQINNLTLLMWEKGETITNYYMAFGGTNLADTAANNIATCYDYSAPIRECGGVGEKYLRVKALGAMIGEHGARLARSKAVACEVTTDQPDVTVAERRGADGGRYLFVRTSQHGEPRSGTARVKATDGSGPELTINYQLETFGSRVLYLPPGSGEASQGQWLPAEQPGPQRPSDLPAPVKVAEVSYRADPGPATWKPMKAGESLNDLGVYDSRFVYYNGKLTLSDKEIPANGDPILEAVCTSGDHVTLVLNGQRVAPIHDRGLRFRPGRALHAGENDIALLYENTGYPNIGPGMEKRAGVTRVRYLPADPDGNAISEWKMHLLDGTTKPAQRPEIAVGFDDSSWQKVAVNKTEASQLRPKQTAAFRATTRVSEEDIKKGRTSLLLSRADDRGWVFVNGKAVGETTDWTTPYTFDAAAALHPGENVIAVVVRNDEGNGGLGRMSLTVADPGDATPSATLTWSDEPAGIAGEWWKADLDASGWTKRPLPESAEGAGDAGAMLTWHRLAFALPEAKPDVWVPWLVRLNATGNGFVYLNGHCIGRYWEQSKQRDFYLPECWLSFGPGGQNVVTLCLRPLEKGTAVESAEVMPYTVYAEKR